MRNDVDAATSVLPMFPLGSTVFPGQIIPLHVFEPRYRALLSHLTADSTADGVDPTFGIVLIERGFEVGGGDRRADVATRVEIVQAEQFDDGRWAVIAAGIERVTIVEWLDDDPYPRARVQPRAVIDNGGDNLDGIEELLRRTLDLAARSAGVTPPDELEFSSDPHTRLDQLCALAPLTDFDRQAILEAQTSRDQIEKLSAALTDKQLILRAQLDGL